MIFFNYVTVKGNTEELYDFLNEIKTDKEFINIQLDDVEGKTRIIKGVRNNVKMYFSLDRFKKSVERDLLKVERAKDLKIEKPIKIYFETYTKGNITTIIRKYAEKYPGLNIRLDIEHVSEEPDKILVRPFDVFIFGDGMIIEGDTSMSKYVYRYKYDNASMYDIIWQYIYDNTNKFRNQIGNDKCEEMLSHPSIFLEPICELFRTLGINDTYKIKRKILKSCNDLTWRR